MKNAHKIIAFWFIKLGSSRLEKEKHKVNKGVFIRGTIHEKDKKSITFTRKEMKKEKT